MERKNGDIPKDLMIEILLRLSVRSLMRFKCVCKAWFALVENPSFIPRHFENQNDDKTCLFLISIDVMSENPRLSLVIDETLTNISYQDLDPQVPILRQVMGPYDGLFCLYGYNELTLWNPATRESKTLPKCRMPVLSAPGDPGSYYCNVGFGLDPVTNDYKLILIRTLWDEERCTSYEFLHVSLYTLTTNSWRHFKVNELIHYFLYKRNDSTYLNGICYWLAFYDHDNLVILSFHMSDEIFQEVNGPCIPAESSSGNLGLYDGFLSLLILDKIESCFDVLIMKDKYWTKQLTVGPFIDVFEPVEFWKKGAFFVESNTYQILLCETSTQELRDMGLSTRENSIRCYKESLVTFKQEDILLDPFEIPWHILGVYERDAYSK